MRLITPEAEVLVRNTFKEVWDKNSMYYIGPINEEGIQGLEMICIINGKEVEAFVEFKGQGFKEMLLELKQKFIKYKHLNSKTIGIII